MSGVAPLPQSRQPYVPYVFTFKMLKKSNRLCLKQNLLGKDVILEICIAEGTFRVPHDDLHKWVGTNKNALKTISWQRDRAYSWSRTPVDMLSFLEQYRVSVASMAYSSDQLSAQKPYRQKLSNSRSAAPLSKPNPPKIDGDAPSLARIAARHCRLPHPAVVKLMDGAVFPVVRGRREQRGKTGTVDDQKIMYDDNTAPKWALLWSHGYSTMAHPKGWMFAHVWDDVKNPDAYTCLANLVMLPESFGGLSDKQGPLVPYLRYHAETVYGWRPAGKDPVAKPLGYDDLVWNYLDSIPDPAGFIRKRMSESGERRVKLLRELLG